MERYLRLRKELQLIRFCIKKYKSCGCKKTQLQRKAFYQGHEELSLSHWNSIVRSAKIRNLTVEISIKEAWDKYIEQNKRCALSGELITFSTRTNTFDGTASLDRKDSTIGYTKENIQWVHKEVNEMKWDKTERDFLVWCEKIYKHNK